jgi:hypothetical protein
MARSTNFSVAGTFCSTPNVQAWMKRFEVLPGYGKPEAILPKETKAAA